MLDFNIFHEVQKKVITIKKFHVDFHNKFIKFWIILFFQLSSYCWIYFLFNFTHTHIYINSKSDFLVAIFC